MPKPFSRLLRGLTASGFALALLAGCANGPVAPEAARWADAGQLVLVTVPDWNSTQGTLRRYQRAGAGRWRAAGAAQPVVIGRTGAAWGLGLHDIPADAGGAPVKREGDGRSPAGVFGIGEAFGYAAQAETALPYAAMDAGDWCIDVPASPLYNRIVDTAEVGAEAVAESTEPMRRDLHANGDQRYRLGFVIEHNPQARPQAGSCIFAHLWQAPDGTTAGCTAMAPEAMQGLLRWLDAARQPVFVLLPQAEYGRLWRAWRLPAPEATP